MQKITVIGGGTGSFVVLSGLKNIDNVELSSIVPSTDSGGSAGRLRDEFGYLPVGDVRQCLVALAENREEELLLRDLFQYRFEKGENGLKGHNFGNLFLTALAEVYGGEIEAIKKAKKILNIRGNVYPVALKKCDLCAEYENGEVITGEHLIDEPPYPHDGRLKITNLYTIPHVQSYSEVKKTIADSDLIILGPGDLYTSIIANFVINDIAESIKNSKAKILFIVNLVTKFGQTFGFSASDHVAEIKKYLGRNPDYILINNTSLPVEILKRYKLQNDYPVESDLKGDNIIYADLLAVDEIVTSKGDILKRSLIRHDGEKIAKVVQKLAAKIKR